MERKQRVSQLGRRGGDEVVDAVVDAVVDVPTEKMPGARPDAAIASPSRPTAAPTQRLMRRPRFLTLLVALGIFSLLNVVVQLNRNYFDAQSDLEWSMRRVYTCESLGKAPDILYLGSSRTTFIANAQLVDTLVNQRFGRKVLGCNVGIFGSSIEQDYYTLKRMIES